jgi:hypothetical protein
MEPEKPKVGVKRNRAESEDDDFSSGGSEYGTKKRRRGLKRARDDLSDAFSSAKDEESGSEIEEGEENRFHSRHAELVQKTLARSGVGADDTSVIDMHHRESMDHAEDREALRKEQEFRNKIAELRHVPAEFSDMLKIVLRRSKIEEWVDEPFFEKTMREVFVKVAFSQKYVIGQVVNIKEDSSQPYTLANGRNCSIYLQLLLTENQSDKLKWFKVIQISNQEITHAEFVRMC